MKMEVVFKDGRKETFDSVESFNVTEEKEECYIFDVAQTPTEGKLFEVNPLQIDRSKFAIRKKDLRQEETRQIIRKAFAKVDKYPEKYATPFYTLIPKKKWNGNKSVEELKEYATDFGGIMADWVEQALEWAQRISNGESWEAICNDVDPATNYRLITWNRECAKIVGNACYSSSRVPASHILIYDYYSHSRVYCTVPLVVIKKKVILSTVNHF